MFRYAGASSTRRSSERTATFGAAAAAVEIIAAVQTEPAVVETATLSRTNTNFDGTRIFSGKTARKRVICTAVNRSIPVSGNAATADILRGAA